MRESYVEGPTSHDDRESCVQGREALVTGHGRWFGVPFNGAIRALLLRRERQSEATVRSPI